MKLPSGTYTGEVLFVSIPALGFLARQLWRGKVIEGDKVLNRIGPFVGLEGRQEAGPGTMVIIRYPFLGMFDELCEVRPNEWHGEFRSKFSRLFGSFMLRKSDGSGSQDAESGS